LEKDKFIAQLGEKNGSSRP